MFTRFRDSLVNPARILEFRKDRVWLALLYILFFAALLSTRTSINMLTFDGISANTRDIIETEISEMDTDCAIVDSELNCPEATRTLVFTDGFMSYYLDSYGSVNPELYEGSYNIIVHDDSFKFVIGGSVVDTVTMKISDLPSEFHNLDFSLIGTEQEDDLFDSLFAGVNAFLVSQKGVFVPIIIISEIIANFLLFLFFVLISSWFMRMRFRPVPFKELFVMTIYSSTALYLILIFDSLFSLSFFLVILLIFVAFRQNNAVSREIYFRLKLAEKKRDEER